VIKEIDVRFWHLADLTEPQMPLAAVKRTLLRTAVIFALIQPEVEQFPLLQFCNSSSGMTSQINRQVRLKARPNGIPQPAHFEIVAAKPPEIADN
jgi:hypothetical protein